MVATSPSAAPVATSLRGVLAAGLVSALALVWAALSLVDEPDQAAQVALSRLAAEVDGAVARELAAGLERFVPGEADVQLTGAPPPAPVPPIEAPGAGRAGSAFGALLRQAERHELVDGLPAEAESALQQALAAAEVPGERALARLRLVQLASARGDPDAARRAARAARDELPGEASRAGLSWRLLIGLAAAPAWTAAERRALVDDWLAGRLPDAAGEPRLVVEADGVRVESSAARAALLARLAASLPAEERAGFDVEQRRVAGFRAVEQAWPGALGAAGAPAAEGRWSLTLLSDQRAALLRRAVARDDVPHTLVVAPARLAAVLRARLAAAAVLPEGFAVQLALDPPGAAAAATARAVRPAGELPGLGLSWTLRHRDVDGLLDELASRSGWQRAALLLAAAFALVATAVAVAALRREARLAALKNAFVASVSHELRTPVAAIQLLTENLQRGVVDDVPRYHAALRTESLRLGRLVDDVLDVSRLQRGEPTRLQREPVEAADLVDGLARDAAEHVAAAGGELVVAPLPGAWPADDTLFVDREALRRALLNLLDNALRHGAGAALPELQVRVDGELLELAVRDHGPGIERGRRAALFRPFEQGPRATAGAGLGLAIVRAIMEGHGGVAVLRDPVAGPGVVCALRLPFGHDHEGEPA